MISREEREERRSLNEVFRYIPEHPSLRNITWGSEDFNEVANKANEYMTERRRAIDE